MKPTIQTNVRFIGDTLALLFETNKQSAVQVRHRSIERITGQLQRFGYVVHQMTTVCKDGSGYKHILIIDPWKEDVYPPVPHGQSGFTIGTTLITEYEPQEPSVFEPAHSDGRAALIYTPPFDYKRVFIPPVRTLTFSFPGMPDGSIDFDFHEKPDPVLDGDPVVTWTLKPVERS